MSGSPIDRVLMTLLIVLGLYVLVKRAKRTQELLVHNKWVAFLFVYMALSIIWSNFPDISLRRGIRSIGSLVMVLVVLTEHSPLDAIRVMLRRMYLIIVPLSVIAIKYYRNIGVSYNWNGMEEEWVGLATDKNSLGQLAMCSGLFFVWQIFRSWPQKKVALDILLLVLALWLLRGSKNSHSSTAIIAFIVCAAILSALQLIKNRSARAKRIVLVTTMMALLAFPFVYLAFDAFNTTPVGLVLSSTGRDLTFTGRTFLWTDVLNNAAKNPVLGVGIGAFWVGPIGYNMYPLPNWSRITPEWRPEQGHNGFVDVYVELGLVGEALLLTIIIIAISGALTHLGSDFALGSLRLALLLSIVINNISETSFLRGTHDLWFLFLLVVVNIPVATPRGRRNYKRLNGIRPGHTDSYLGAHPRFLESVRSSQDMYEFA